MQELAFTLADGIGYVEECVKRGLDVDDFAPRLSFFWDVHNDFFEEIAKFRAARRMWARIMKERFGAKDPRSMQLRTHAQTAGVSLTAQQPYNNVVRVGAAGARRGARRHPVAAHQLAGRDLRAAHRGVGDDRAAHPADHRPRVGRRPRGRPARWQLLRRVPHRRDGEAGHGVHHAASTSMGGIIRAVEEGYPQKEIAESAYRYQREVEQGERVIVGVNAFRTETEAPIELLQDRRARAARADRAARAGPKAERDQATVDGGAGRGRGGRATEREPDAPGARGGARPTPPWARSATCSARSAAPTAKAGRF